MAQGPINWERELKAMKDDIAQRYPGYETKIVAMHTTFGGMKFILTLRIGSLYEDRTVEVEDTHLSPWHLMSTVAEAILAAFTDMQEALWDPTGELKTKSVKEVYSGNGIQ